MFDMFNSQYFKALSENVKDQVLACGLIFDTETELREYVSEIME